MLSVTSILRVNCKASIAYSIINKKQNACNGNLTVKLIDKQTHKPLYRQVTHILLD